MIKLVLNFSNDFITDFIKVLVRVPKPSHWKEMKSSNDSHQECWKTLPHHLRATEICFLKTELLQSPEICSLPFHLQLKVQESDYFKISFNVPQ